jgi:hypothetical protein
VLHSGGPNHSKLSHVHVLDVRLAGQAKRLSLFLILGFRAGALRHPAREFPLRQRACLVHCQTVRPCCKVHCVHRHLYDKLPLQADTKQISDIRAQEDCSKQQTIVAPSTTSVMFLGPHVGAQYPCTCPP